MRNPVEESIERDRAQGRSEEPAGPVARIARNYDASSTGESGRSSGVPSLPRLRRALYRHLRPLETSMWWRTTQFLRDD